MTPTPKLNFLIFGAGAIGAYIGASVSLKGHPVVFIEQPNLVPVVRERGLSLRRKDGEHHISNPQVTEALEVALSFGPFDAAVFALKSFDTRPALASLAPLAAQLPPFLCLQNGVENEALLAEVLGWDKVIAGTVTSAIGRRGPGQVTVEKQRGMGVAAGHPLSKQLAAVLDEAKLNAYLYPDGGSMKWSKLLSNLLGNATSAILNMSTAEIYAHRRLVRLEMEMLRETLRVMDAQGLKAINLPRTPVRYLALAARRLPAPIALPFLQRAVGRGRGDKMPSFHIDLHAGRGQSEVEYLNGAVARFGEKLGVPTPVNQKLTEILLALTRKEIPLDTFSKQPERLLGEIGYRV